MRLTYDDLYTLLNGIAQGNSEWHSKIRNVIKKVDGALEVDQFINISTQNAALQNHISNIKLGVT